MKWKMEQYVKKREKQIREVCDWIPDVGNKQKVRVHSASMRIKIFTELTKNINSESRNHTKPYAG